MLINSLFKMRKANCALRYMAKLKSQKNQKEYRKRKRSIKGKPDWKEGI